MRKFNTYVFDLDGNKVQNKNFCSFESARDYLNSFRNHIVAIIKKNEIVYVAYHDKHINRNGYDNYYTTKLSY